MSNDDFYTSIQWNNRTGMDQILSENKDLSKLVTQKDMVQQLTDSHRCKNALMLPVSAGSRVSFTGNLGAILSYTEVPSNREEGEVVTVRSSSMGDITSFNDHAFVKWDSGKFGAYHVEHLRRAKVKTASSHVIRTSSLGDISGFLPSASGDNDLVHRATRDLWSFSNSGDGYVIERLFNEQGDPLKE